MDLKNEAIRERSEIPQKFKWNLEAMYESDEAWEADFARLPSLVEELQTYKGRLTANAGNLLSALRLQDQLGILADNLFVYARMRRDEDNRKPEYQAMTDRCMGLLADQIGRASCRERV